jgi:TolB-like protein/DNA-binding winged helix-turn-helix (wHTH) protein/Flp pilus assembly protein TadD
LSELFLSGFRLGDRAVDPKNGRIDGPDGVANVTPKAMEILLCLASEPAELVEREELIKAGWGTTEGHEESLTRCIAELRHALGDHFDEPTFIQTIPRRGYRLVAPVSIDAADGDELTVQGVGARSPSSLWDELKRRDVMRTSLAYAAAAWLVIEVVSVLAPIFAMPDWTLRTLVVMAIIGFPIVAALSWALQITPSGLAIDMPVREGASGPRLATARKVDLVIIATLMIAVSFLLYREFRPDEPAPGFGSAQSVAVLPFDNLSDNVADEYLSDGLAEELLNLLAQTADLDVTSRKASFYYKGKDVPLKSIVSALGVRNIVEGSVQRSGERIRITVQLVDAQSLMHRWSESYDATEPDLIGIRDTIARKVAAELKTVMTDRGESIIARDAATDRSAYLLYLKALGEIRKEHTDETLGEAEALLKEAIGIDPDFAQAQAALCDTYIARYIVAGREQSYFDSAESACQRALALDGGLAEVYVALGNLYRESGDFGAALLEFEHALSLDTNSYDAIFGMALTLEAQGTIEQAETRFEELPKLEPGYWQAYNAIGNFYYGQGRFAEAAYNFRRAAVLAPRNALAFNNLGAAQYMQGDYRAAAKAWEESVRIRPSNLVLSNIGLAAYYAGEYDKAVEMQQKAIAESPEDFRIWGRLGDSHRQAGDTAEAEQAYQKALGYASLAVERNPSDEETLRYLSLYYSFTGDSEAAIRAIERARMLQPESSRVHYFASKVYFVAGNTDRAVQELEQALSKGYSLAIASADPDLRSLRDSGRIEILATGQRI